MGPREDIEAWVLPKVESWIHGVHNLPKISKHYPQLAYTGLGMLLHLEWQYMQRTVPEVRTLVCPNEDA